ncbi:hypothetical protein BJX63DRAFT_433863 [Aspergillus granulosus]|uniref:Uncharacterized protein n=1 Tax=Aspergillus granulosus TaxID=176169 RepID=A0ABR4H609_9EURO
MERRDDSGLAAVRPWKPPPSSTPNGVDALLLSSLYPGFTDKSTAEAREVHGLPYTPLEVLDRVVKGIFDVSIEDASLKYSALEDSVLRGTTVIDRGYARSSLARFIIEKFPWHHSKLAARLVLLFACPADPHHMLEAMRFENDQLQGLTTMLEVKNTPSADLASRFARAKREALSGAAKVTVLGVSLIDVASLERVQENSGADTGFSSFSHHFTLAIGREGWRMYQAYEKAEGRFDEWLMKITGGSRLRSWDWAETWISDFQRIRGSIGTWTTEINDAYTRCFDMNLDLLCGEGKRYPPLIPLYRPWVKIQEINNVKVEDICKFEWKVGRSWD